MRFKLGMEIITAKNDGGIHIQILDPKWRDWNYAGRKPLPVLSLEVLYPSTLPHFLGNYVVVLLMLTFFL